MEGERQRGYKGAREALKRFQRLNGIYNWQPGIEETVTVGGLEGYLTDLIQRMNQGKIRPGTIYEYLAHLNTAHQLKGEEWSSTRNHARIKAKMKEVEHFIPDEPKKQAHAVTIQEMETFCRLLNPEVPDEAKLGAAATMLFSGLGRVAEVLGTHHPMRRKDLREEGALFRVYLRSPKTRKDKCQHLDPIPLEMPVNAQIWLGRLVHHHHQTRGQQDDGIWTMSDGSTLTSKSFLTEFKRRGGIAPEVKLDNTSFRSGGATHLASLGIPLDRIQVLGRWKTTTYEQYLRQRSQTLGLPRNTRLNDMHRV